MEPSANPPTKLLLILSGLFMFFILGSAGYYFYLNRQNPFQGTTTEEPRDFDLALNLAPKPQGPPDLNPFTNKIDLEKAGRTFDALFVDAKIGFFSSTFITVIYTGEVVEVVTEPKEVGGTVYPAYIRVQNESGETLRLNFSQVEIDNARIFLSRNTGDITQVDEISFAEIRPADDVLITVSVNLLDSRIDVDDISIDVKRS